MKLKLYLKLLLKDFKIIIYILPNKDNTLLLTSSLDSTLKAFHLTSAATEGDIKLKLERSINDTKYIFKIDSIYFGTFDNDSSYVQHIFHRSII